MEALPIRLKLESAVRCGRSAGRGRFVVLYLCLDVDGIRFRNKSKASVLRGSGHHRCQCTGG